MTHVEFGVSTDQPCVANPDCSGTMVFPDVTVAKWFARDPQDTKRLDGYCATCGATIERWNTSNQYSRLVVRVIG